MQNWIEKNINFPSGGVFSGLGSSGCRVHDVECRNKGGICIPNSTTDVVDDC